MRISTKGRGIIRAQQGAVARPNPKENYKLPEDQRYQAQTRGMKDFAADVYIDGVPDGFITIPRSGTLDYQGATFFDRNFHFNLPTDLTNVSKLLFTGYFSTYRVTVDADSVTNNAVCQSGVTTEIPINQAYIGGDTANISINVII